MGCCEGRGEDAKKQPTMDKAKLVKKVPKEIDIEDINSEASDNENPQINPQIVNQDENTVQNGRERYKNKAKQEKRKEIEANGIGNSGKNENGGSNKLKSEEIQLIKIEENKELEKENPIQNEVVIKIDTSKIIQSDYSPQLSSNNHTSPLSKIELIEIFQNLDKGYYKNPENKKLITPELIIRLIASLKDRDSEIIELALKDLLGLLKLPISYDSGEVLYEDDALYQINCLLHDMDEMLRFLASKLVREMLKQKSLEVDMIKRYQKGAIIAALVQANPNFTSPKYLKSNLHTLFHFVYDSDHEIIVSNQEILFFNNMIHLLNQTQLKIPKLSTHPDWNLYDLKIMKLIEDLKNDAKIDLNERKSLISPRQSYSSFSSETDTIFPLNIYKYSLEDLIAELNTPRRIKSTLLNETWAEAPTTVGSLSAARMAELFADKILDDPKTISLIIQTNAIEKLRENLKSRLRDKRESAMICLLHMVQPQYPELCDLFMNDEGLALAFTFLQDNKEGMRAAAVDILRGYYFNRPEAIERIRKCGLDFVGEIISVLTGLNSPSNVSVVLLNIRDMFVNEEGETNREVLNLWKNKGLNEALEKIDIEKLKLDAEYPMYGNQIIDSINTMKEELLSEDS
ncbi:unnamed protein product [Blepharisma stoltei]|uniref:Nucleotide exchange factor SIL1 n=1 Tax=Blepharisma stoltei TaxID=1481888 RepID=A0AAU9IBI8_9CILI|nr:unnamed protein product [Blepharisma stoltei]